MANEKLDWKTLRIVETKEIINDHNVLAIKEQLQHLRTEVNRLEGLLNEAKKVGIDPDNMVEPEKV